MAIFSAGEGVFLDANQSFLDLTGWSHDQVVGATVESLDLWPDPQEQGTLQERLAQETTLHNVQLQLRIRGGALRTVLAAFAELTFAGQPAILGTFWDVTDQQESAAQQAELMELAIALRGGGDSQGVASIAIVYLEEIFQAEGALLTVQAPAAPDSVLEIARGRGEELLAPLYARRLHRRAFKHGESYAGLAHWATGERPWAYCLPLPAATVTIGVLWLFTTTQLSPTTRTLLQTAADLLAAALYRAYLRSESEEESHHLRRVLEAMPVGILLLDARGYILLTNWLGTYYLNLLTGGTVPEPLSRLGQRPLSHYATASGDSAGHDIAIGERRLAVRLIPTGEENGNQILTLTDVTDVRRDQAKQLVESRLASVGRLAAGIAHEFNNVLASASLDAELLLRHPELPASAASRLQQIHDQMQRGARLVQQVLDFSERSVLNRQRLSLSTLLQEMESELRGLLPDAVRLTLPPANGYWIDGDRLRLQTLLMNLAQNSADAMPEGGELAFSLAHVGPEDLGDELPPFQDEEPPARWVRLEVRDTGRGIVPHDLERLFDPFYTTANPLSHRGLGLPQAYGIVRQHGGLMQVASEPGAGATFTIFLPAAGPAA
jgi:PAS domain S-box-containing protein